MRAFMKFAVLVSLSTWLLAAGPALAVDKPAFNKTWSWNLTSTTGGLSMELRNGNAPTEVHFVYGTDANLAGGTTVGKSNQPGVSGGIQSHAQLKALKPGTTYYFKAYAKNSGGSAESGMNQFTTLKAEAPKISGLSHSTVTWNGALVSMTVQNNEPGTTQVMFATTADMAGAQSTRTQSQNGGDKAAGAHHDLTPNLKPDTTYYYQGVAVNPFGTTKSGVQSFKTAAGGPKPPVVNRIWSWTPPGKPATTSAGLSMEIQNHGQSSQVFFEYGTDSGLKGAAKVGAQNLNGYATGVQSHAELKNLQPKTTYYFRATATTPSGTAVSGIQSFKTQ
jgi:phosphodiesterase/alkaline phosphatase D-like protein